MELILPVVITDARLTSTDVAEDDYSEFSFATTYADGDRVIISTAEIVTLDVAPAINWEEGDLITGQSSTETAYVVEKLTTLTYLIRERSGAFTLDESIGVTGTPAKIADQGAAHPTVETATDLIHNIYESLSAANTGNYPPTDIAATTPKWIFVSATNAWKMFDDSVSTQTVNSTAITVVVTPGFIDHIVILNTECDTVNVTITSISGGGEVFNETQTGQEYTVLSLWQYFFSPIIEQSEFVFNNIPPHSDAIVTITISKAASDAACGVCIFGLGQFIGDAQYGLSIGARDYSIKETNTFGYTRLEEGAFSNRMNVDFLTDRYQAIQTKRLFETYRATNLVWIVNPDYSDTIVYGFIYDYNQTKLNQNIAVWSLTIEGII